MSQDTNDKHSDALDEMLGRLATTTQGRHRPTYTVDDVVICLAMYCRGDSYGEIEAITGVTKATVWRWRLQALNGTLEAKYPTLHAAASQLKADDLPARGTTPTPPNRAETWRQNAARNQQRMSTIRARLANGQHND